MKLSAVALRITPAAAANGFVDELFRSPGEDTGASARDMIDQSIAVEISGAEAGERIGVRASMRDDRKRLWESHAVFAADGLGVASLAHHAPVAGSYAGVDPMGLLWSLALDSARTGAPTPWTKKDLSPAIVELSVERNYAATFTTRVERHFFLPGTCIIDVRDNGLVGRLFVPPGTGRRPAVVIMGGSGGGLDWEKAAVLSSHGYITLALAYFGIAPLPGSLQNIPLEYFGAAIDWVRRHPDVDGERIGVMGISKGGELALLLGVYFPESIRAVIGVVPSAVVWPGFGKGLHSSWTYQGQPLPFVPTPTGWFQTKSFFRVLAARPIAFRNLYEAALKNHRAVANAAIPVEKIRAPVLLISGGDDQVWPSPRMSRMIMERLDSHAFPYPYEHACYEGAGHAFRCPYTPATVSRSKHPSMPVEVILGGSPVFQARGQLEAWQRTLRFLKRQL